MKKKVSILMIFLALTLAYTTMLSGCGQSQTEGQSSENSSAETILTTEDNQSAASLDESELVQEPEEIADSEDIDNSETAPELAQDASTDPQQASQDTVSEASAPEPSPAPAPAVQKPAEATPVPEVQAEQQTSEPAQQAAPEPAAQQAAEPVQTQEPAVQAASEPAPEPQEAAEPEPESASTDSGTSRSGANLTVQFGYGDTFTLHLYDNDTAAKIAEYVGTADWQLPIYHYDDYDNWEVMQFYDIPSRYDIPSNPQSVSSEKAGAVYYSHPNRIILFYQDAEVSSEYTPVGYIDFSQALVDAVENNPVVEGWGNKLVFIRS